GRDALRQRRARIRGRRQRLRPNPHPRAGPLRGGIPLRGGPLMRTPTAYHIEVRAETVGAVYRNKQRRWVASVNRRGTVVFGRRTRIDDVLNRLQEIYRGEQVELVAIEALGR